MTIETDEDRDRRDFLRTCGRFAVVTPPAMTVLLSTSLTSTAIARSGGQSSGTGGGGSSDKKSIFDNEPERGPPSRSGGSDGKSDASGSDRGSKSSGQSPGSSGQNSKASEQASGGSDQGSKHAGQPKPSGPASSAGGGNQQSQHQSSLEVEIATDDKVEAKLDPADHVSINKSSTSYHVSSGDVGDDDYRLPKAKPGLGLQ